MRLSAESYVEFSRLVEIDREEAVTNRDMAFEAKLEKFHALYDITKTLPGFTYFDCGDTALLIALRNAIHHRDHTLFHSWNSRIGHQDSSVSLTGQRFLLASTTPGDNALTMRFYYLLNDFYERLRSIPKAEKMRALWNAELQFSEIEMAGKAGGFSDSQVYVDVMPAFISAMHRVQGWLAAIGFTPYGFDGKVYFQSFSEPVPQRRLGFKVHVSATTS
ncbi:hypothetical protein [Herbaspirillum huttiense]|uniref:hypothetical protein n=1 Tax=Herbaspirillum huttiense TaxID=863372 RepID=UPI0031DD284A